MRPVHHLEGHVLPLLLLRISLYQGLYSCVESGSRCLLGPACGLFLRCKSAMKRLAFGAGVDRLACRLGLEGMPIVERASCHAAVGAVNVVSADCCSQFYEVLTRV